MIGLSYYDKKLKVKFTSFNQISFIIENIEQQILDYKSKNNKSF